MRWHNSSYKAIHQHADLLEDNLCFLHSFSTQRDSVAACLSPSVAARVVSRCMWGCVRWQTKARVGLDLRLLMAMVLV